MMRGGVFHEHMLDQLEDAFRALGHATERQAPARHQGELTGYVDLLVHLRDCQFKSLAVELEMDPKRATNDLRKRRDLARQLGQPVALWIVTPTTGKAKTIQRAIQPLATGQNQGVQILAFGTAIKRLRSNDL